MLLRRKYVNFSLETSWFFHLPLYCSTPNDVEDTGVASTIAWLKGPTPSDPHRNSRHHIFCNRMSQIDNPSLGIMTHPAHTKTMMLLKMEFLVMEIFSP